MTLHISDFDYELPEELIAQEPLPDRDASRMMIANRDAQETTDSFFLQLTSYLHEGDTIVLNNTRVFPARLVGERVPSGGQVELLLVNEIAPNTWEALTRPARRVKTGQRLRFAGSELIGEVLECLDDGIRVIHFTSAVRFPDLLDQIGQTPLPPYIKREHGAFSQDHERYQTIYASARGAVAAPTAGLHFTDRILNQLKANGVRVAEITLHVGYGTFQPVRVDDISTHSVAPETYSISESAAEIINRARADKNRIVAIGTTTARALESASEESGLIKGGSGTTSLTIVPGYRFRAIDALLTNFHLPRSSLLMLVSAFAGREFLLDAYRHAVAAQYRFYSYGDCMLII
jgi:S-adenosylmethionine:tRNA ribosyltransferase-isomerase